ncbi:glutathione hydrolase 1 proenzyme-like [Amphiura filiformis]|uniref:glutathione hydrolase 1 proenzyme-like n=1 Tax=Amphiura filiformis TaxID=82378 RepID=UPI003B2124B3
MPDDTGGDSSSQFRYKNAAIASDSATCSQIGREILEEGGSAVDAAIGSLLCIGTMNPNNIGIGGGHFLMHYNAGRKEVSMYDAREVAPLAATEDMFVNDTTGRSTRGGLAIAVPGDVKGYYEVHRDHGRLPWKRLFEPSIRLARDGFAVTDDLGGAIAGREEVIREEPNMRNLFVKSNGELLAEGDTFRHPRYADTLEAIAENGGDYFYNEMADDIVRDIEDAGGIITREDLRQYNVRRRNPISITLNGGFKVYTPPPPSSGVVVSLIFNILDGFFGSSPDADNYFKEQSLLGLTYHRLVEAFKFGFGQRGNLADSSFVNVYDVVNRLTSRRTADEIRETIKDDGVYDNRFYGNVLDTLDDRGTSHLSVIDKDGNAVSVTQTLNFGFGSKVLGSRTGIVFNNEMDDFAVPGGPPNAFGFSPTDVNLIAPGKRPQSSMAPVIIVDSNYDVYMVIGSSGGSRIISAIPQAFSFIHFGQHSLANAVDQPRIHQQWLPADIHYDGDFARSILDDLQSRGQVLASEANTNVYSVIQVVKRESDGYLYAHSDKRRGKYTGPDGY